MDNLNNSQNNTKSTTPIQVSDRNIDPISFFAKDEIFVYVFKKTEKLATALYMVTNLFSESEPMKWALRKKVGELLSYMVGYKDTIVAEKELFGNFVETRVLEIVALLEISSRSGLVSTMNFSVLKKEFSNLLEVLNSASKTAAKESERTNLSQTFFEVNEVKPVQNVAPQVPVIKDTTNVQSVSSEPLGFKKTNRQNIILNMLKKRRDVSIKDISDVIKDCSEKTIQRELIALIENGVIQKIGERRWSRYSLKQPVQ